MNIDPAAITLVQTNFLQHLQAIFAVVTRYALNLLYIFAVLELVLLGFMWAFESGIAWGRFIFKILKIGLIFLIIQNYDRLLASVIDSFGQIAGLTVSNAKVANLIFNPATIWQYGYDAGLFLLREATQSASLGLTIVQCGLGMGILLVFGLLGIQIIVQVVGFYLVALIALLLLPFGIFQPSAKMFDRAVHSVFESGVRVMALIMVIGIAALVWDRFSLTQMTTEVVNINQPLGLFFTALLFLNLAYYLPKFAALVVGDINSSFVQGSSLIYLESASLNNTSPAKQSISSDLSEVHTACAIDAKIPTLWSGTGLSSFSQGIEVATSSRNFAYDNSPSSSSSAKNSFLREHLKSQELPQHTKTLQKSISRETIDKMKSMLLKFFQEQQQY